MRPGHCRLWLLPLVALAMGGCSSGSDAPTTLPLPTGHYEGPISYQGTELRVALDLREVRPGELEADVHFPALGGYSFAAAKVRYQEPQLLLEQAGQSSQITVTAIREGDFLRGVFTLDSLKAEFVWARRGQAAPRAYQEKSVVFQLNGRPQRLMLLVPNDTVARHPAIALLADATSTASAPARADLLARQGFLTVILPTPAPAADSVALHHVAAAIQALRRQPVVDSLHVGLWLRDMAAVALVPAAGITRPAASFVVLENVPVTSADDSKPFQQISRQGVAVLALYAAADTSLDVSASARRLRQALAGRRGSVVRTFPQASPDFIVPGRLSADGKWTWPQPAPGFVEELTTWLRQQTSR